MFDLSSAWLEGHSCPLGALGISRDGNREQIQFGMVTSRAGIPVAVRVFAGNTSDSVAFGEIIPVVRGKFGLDEVIMVGDRGSVTKVRISQLKALPGAGWITALRAPSKSPPWPGMTGPCRCRCSTTRTSPRSPIPDIPASG